MLTEIKTHDERYFRDEQGRVQGEYNQWHRNGQLKKTCFYVDDQRFGEFKMWDDNGQLIERCLFYHNRMRGEYKRWHSNGDLEDHCFYDKGKRIHHDQIPRNPTDEDRMYFMLKYDMQLLPVEVKC